jgi:5-methylcytosine-specific restriction endonuclease McrA
MPGPDENSGIVVRSEVGPVRHYREYREVLRHDFWYACAYCSMAEIESRGIAFEIEHYEPAGDPKLEHAYHNLMWACAECNDLKTDWTPPAEARAQGLRFIRPDHDDPRDHLELDAHDPERLAHRTCLDKVPI